MKSLPTTHTTSSLQKFGPPLNLRLESPPASKAFSLQQEKNEGPHHVLVRSEDGGRDDSQEQADHVEHHRGPQEAVQVDDVPAAADSGELIVLRVVLCAGGKHRRQGTHQFPFPAPSEQLWKERFGSTPTTRSGKVEGQWRVTKLPDQTLRGCQRSCKHFIMR